MSNKLEQLEFKLEKKVLGFRNMQEKLENWNFPLLILKIFDLQKTSLEELWCWKNYKLLFWRIFGKLIISTQPLKRGKSDLSKFFEHPVTLLAEEDWANFCGLLRKAELYAFNKCLLCNCVWFGLPNCVGILNEICSTKPRQYHCTYIGFWINSLILISLVSSLCKIS